MENTVGKTIQTIATVLMFVFASAGFISFIVFIALVKPLIGFVSLISGVVLSVLCFVLKGFGQMVEDVREIRTNMSNDKKPQVSEDLPEL